MCSRMEDVLTDRARAALIQVLGPLEWLRLSTSGEVRPTDAVSIVRLTEGGQREVVSVRWGFVPAGMSEAELKKYAMFNARIETLNQSRVFADAFQSQRCVIPLSAFYEWPTVEGRKQKTRMARPDGLPLLVAGLWNRAAGPLGVVESCTVITRSPTPDLLHVHDRMPALLLSSELQTWLHGTPEQAEAAALSSWRPGVLDVQAV